MQPNVLTVFSSKQLPGNDFGGVAITLSQSSSVSCLVQFFIMFDFQFILSLVSTFNICHGYIKKGKTNTRNCEKQTKKIKNKKQYVFRGVELEICIESQFQYSRKGLIC